MNRILSQKAILLISILFLGLSTNGLAISFNNGSPQSVSYCKSSTNSINSLLTATDVTGLTFTWTVTAGPSHGTLGGFPAVASSGTSVAPSFTSYVPTSGYVGSDAFTIQVSNGTTSVTTTINVVVNPTPTVTSVSPNVAAPLSTATITGTNFNATASNNIVYFGSTRAAVLTASSTALTVAVPNGAVYAPVTVENNSCALVAAYSQPFLPTYSNTGFAPNTLNFSAHTDFSVAPGTSPNHIAYGDIDGDGKVDIITNNFGSNSVSIFRNTSTSGSLSFSLAVTLSGFTSPGQPAVGDLDGDGLLDIAVGSAAPPGFIFVYRNTSTPGSISFASALSVSYTTNANATVIADIDGDGLNDLVSCFGSTMSVFLNTGSVGTLSFAARTDFASTANITSITAGDIDGDGKTDVAVSNNTNNISAWRNTSTSGAASFAARQDFTTAGTAFGITIADLNNDGKMELLNANSTTANFSLFAGTSVSGTISMGARTDFGTGANPQNITVGDFDGDGVPDVAVSSISAGNVGVFRNTGSLTFATRVDFTTAAGAAGMIAADIDGDGKSDIAVTNQTANNFSILRNFPLSPNTGTATVCPGLTTTLSNSFAGGGTWTTSDATIATVVAGTGVVTGVMAGTANITFTTTGTLQTVVTTVTVTAAPTVTNISPVVGFPAASVTITGTNFNTTSTNDIVWFGGTRATVNSASATSLNVSVPVGAIYTPVTVENAACGLQSSSRMPFLQNYSNSSYIANTVNFDPRFDLSSLSQPADVALGDFDGDGKLDLVVANFPNTAMRVYLNTSTAGTINSGSYSSFVALVNPSPDIFHVSVADMDGDGKLDIVTSTVLGGTNRIAVFRNTSSGAGTLSFAAALTVASTGSSFNGLTFADLDGDGKPEIIGTLANILVYKNNSVPGTLNFSSALSFATAGTPNSIAAFDIDGDGKIDLINGGNSGAGTISVLRNISSGSTINFAANVDFAAGLNSISATCGDIDGDGKLDVVVTNSIDNTISVLRNTSSVGSVNFASQVIFATLAFPSRVAIGDGDGDGKADVYVCTQGGHAINVFRNTATSGTINSGSFATRVDFAVSGTPTGIVMGDIDGDGKADVVTAPGLSGGGNVSILRNDPLQPITGTFVVCENGPTSTLSEAAPGGIWTSSNPAVATVGSATGIVAGISAGTATITYQGTATALTLGNYTVQTVTVNAQSSAAFTASPNPFCIGNSSTFNNASSGIVNYAWNFGDLTSGAGNNPVHTYTAAGTYSASLQVTNTNGCISTSTGSVVVNPLPAAIAGTLAVCTGSTTTLSDASPGGTWSSASPGVATVVAGTGVVTGVTPGTSVITYTLPTGCIITATVTVNQTPAAISVPGNVCVGSTITLTDATGGGTWSSNNTALATVVAGTGVVTGVSAGSPIISYTIPATGCFNSATVVVNPLPASIAGSLAICSGLTSTLTDATTGGTWSSSAPGVASVVPATGVVTGVAAGPANATITYTLPTTCIATAQVTINPNPTGITGTTTVCTGLTTALGSTPAGGTWSSSDVTLATVSGTGVVTGVAAGSPVITYTLPTGCIATATVVVNTTPAAITGTTTLCVGATTTLSDVTPGGTWSSSNTAQATVGATTGIVSGVAAGSPNIIYIMPSGCNATVGILVNPLPAAIGGTTNVCVGGTTTLTDVSGVSTWTSSNPTFATVGAATGIVTGIAAGSLNITFTLPTGCAVSVPFVVNPTPPAITGASSVCAGLTTTFANAVTGGTWSSAAPGTASVVAGTGVVTGVTAGSTNIIYTLPAGCTATKSILVNPQPVGIVGSNNVCVGLTTTLTDATGGGTWSSSNTATATITSGGVVSGVAAGAINISYTLPAGCFTVLPFTVNPTPAAIAGASVVCAGSTINLSDVTAGGTWSSSNAGQATVGATTGVVTGVAAGTPNITYTLPAGCTAVYPIVVNPVPNITSFSSPSATSQCASVAGVVTVNSATLGAGTFTVTYNLSGANTATASTATLTMGGAGSGTFTIPSGSLPNSGATTVTITSLTNSFGCTSAVSSSNTAAFTVYPYPVAYTVTGTGSYCAGGAGLHIILSNSEGGISYQLYRNGSSIGAPVAGTYAALDMGLQTLAGTYTVIGTNTTTLCATNQSGTAVITVNPLPTTYNVTGGGSYCSGGTGVVIGLNGSDNSVNYQLYNAGIATGSPVAGTGAAISFGLQTAGGTYTVVATNATTTCTNTMTGSAIITVNPLPAAVTGTLSVCAGLTTTLASATAGGIWTSVNTAAATIVGASGVLTGVAAGTSTISYTLPTGCAITAIATVNPLPAAIVGAGIVCTGSTMALTDATASGTWSSSNAGEATIGAATGIVTGVAAGTPTMTYTLGTGCIATAQITVNTTPVAITGVASVCPGATTLLTNTTPGGTWASSNTTMATVVAGTGLVTGVAAGNPVISYTLAGCSATIILTVNPLPADIAGTTAVCVGATTTLSDAITGGTWSSSNTAFATVVAGTGVVTGVSAGIVTISYTLPTGCFKTTTVTVNAIPAGITGVATACIGQTSNMGNAVAGGTWSSSNTGIASVVAATGVVSGVAAGTATITYTLPGGCFTTVSFIVNPNPAAIVGTAAACVGLTTTLTDPTSGGSWTSSNAAIASISGTGVVTGVASGNATITYTLPTGCIATRAFTTNPNPSAITGSSSVCAGSSITLASTPAGGSWTSSNTSWATVVSGTGVVTGVAAGVPNITYTLPTGCINTAAITVNPTPVAVTGSNTVCTGLTTTLADATTGGTWSSSDLTKATVGSATGIVTGVAAGSINITYTLPAGCTAIFPMTVNTQPAAIAGSATVCTGFTTTLTDAVAGGTWTSSNTSFATVSGTGVVSGIAAGTLNITYTMPGGCTSILPMTVNPTPAPITSVSNVCVGSTIAMTDASLGGLWSSSNAGLGSIGSVSGILTGVSAGSINITYTLPAGCIVTFPLTVNPLPAAIAGVSTVCEQATSTLTDASAGGVWTSSNAATATIGSLTGTITGVAAGTVTFTYTLPTGCIATRAGVVNAIPGLFTMTGGGNYCAGGSGVTVGLNGSVTGINYQLFYNNGTTNVTMGSPLAGTGGALSFGLMTGGGVYTVVGTVVATGCNRQMLGSATVSVNPLPALATVTGGGSYCAGGTGVAVGLNGSASGTNYQLYNTGIAAGTPVAGTGSAISFGNQSVGGVYSVVATVVATGCTQLMTGIASVVVSPLPTVYNVTGGGGYCVGGSGVHIFLSNSDAGISYQLKQGGTNVGAALAGGGPLDFGFLTTTGAYTVVATNTVSGCTNTMAGTVSITTNPLPTNTFTVGGGGTYCAGGAGLPITLSSSQTGISYQLYYGGVISGTPVTGTGGLISFGARAGAGVYTVIGTNLGTGCSSTMSGSGTITVTTLPTAFTMTGGGSFCSGSAGVTVGLSGSQVGATYGLYLGGVFQGNITGTGAPLTSPVLTAPGIYTVIATLSGCTANMIGTSSIIVNPLPVVYNVTGSGSYCAGGAGVHVLLSNSDLGINYQVFRAGAPVSAFIAGTGAALDLGAFFVAGTYTVVATNATTLCTSNMTGSAVISITPLPTAFNVTGGGSYCTGGTGVAIGLNGSTVGVNYQLYNGVSTSGAIVAGTGSSLNFGLKTTTGSYTVVATNASTGCLNTMNGSAVVNTTALPLANTVTGGGAYCAGGAGVHIGLDGSDPANTYMLYNGTTPSGAALAGTGSALDFGFRFLAGTYTVVATATATGCSNNMTGSATIIVNPLPTSYTVTGGGSYCTGGAGVRVGLGNSALGINYQLYRNAVATGLPVAGTGSALDFGLQTNVGTYTVVATDATSGCTANMAGSVAVNVYSLPAVYTVSGGGNYCSGGSGVDVNLSGSTFGVNYQLYNGTTPIAVAAGTGLFLDFGLQTAAGSYTVVASNATTGCTSNMTGSAIIVVNPLPVAYTVTGGGSYCATGTGVHVGLSNTQVGTSYQLYNGVLPVGTAIVGAGSAIDFGLQTLPGTYTVEGTSTSMCESDMSGAVTVSVNPLPVAYTVTGGGSYCAGSTGVYVGLSGSNTGVNYQLYRGTTAVGGPVTGTGLIIDFGVQSIPGVYTVVATNSATACTTNMSGSATVTATPLPTVYAMTGGGSYCAGGAGLPVGLSNSAMGVNYQLYRGTMTIGDPVAGTGMALAFGLQTAAGTYTVVATDALNGCINNMSGVANVVINPLPLTYSVTGGGSYCSTLASTLHVGLTSSQFGNNYQLYINGVSSGSPLAGTGAALDFGVQSLAGSYTIVGTNAASGCSSNMTGSATITINAAPAVYTVAGGGGYCIGGAGVHVSVDGSASGINYQLYRGTTMVGSAVAGTGIGVDFGLQTVGGSYSVVATDPSSGCTSNMTGTATVVVNTLPAAFTVTGGGSFCAGGAGVHVMLNGSASGVNYQLYYNGSATGSAIAGTGLTLDMGVESLPGTYTVVATNATTGCTSNMLSSTVVAINALPAQFEVTGGGSYCIGGAGVPVGLSGSVIGNTYRLYRGGVATGGIVAGTGAALNFGIQTIAGVYTVVASDPSTGCSSNMITSVSVAVNPMPVVYSVAGGGTFCAGGAGVDVYLSNSDATISYQLYHGTALAGSPVIATGGVLHFGAQTVAGTYTVVATNPATGCTSNMTGAATININALPAVHTMTGGGSYCAGGTGVHVSLNGSNTGISYQLFRGGAVGTPVSGTGLPIDFGLQTTAGTYSVVATNVATGCTENMIGTSTVGINALPGTQTVLGGGNYCAGGTGVEVSLGGSATGISYQLYTTSPLTATGAPVFGNGSAVSFGLQTAGATYTVIATDSATGCTRNMTGSATVVVTPVVIPSVTIISSLGDTVCEGTSVTYSAVSVNGGTSPAYQWSVNGTGSGSGSSYTYIPAAGDNVQVKLTSSAACPAPDTAVAHVSTVVRTNLMPSISIVALPGDTVCNGTVVNFTSSVVNGGSAPAYSWMINSTMVGTGSSYSYVPVDNDIVLCKLTSNYPCLISATVLSNFEHMTVQPGVAPVVTVGVSYGTSIGATVYNTTLTATVTNAGFAPAYQWLVNGTAVAGATSVSYTAPVLKNNDIVACFVTTNSACGAQNATGTATIASATVGVKPVVGTGSDIRLVPNPNKGNFTISGNTGVASDEMLTLEITDMIGQVVYNGKVSVHNGEINQHVVLDRTLANGMYLLNLRSGSDSKVFHMVVEQ